MPGCDDYFDFARRVPAPTNGRHGRASIWQPQPPDWEQLTLRLAAIRQLAQLLPYSQAVKPAQLSMAAFSAAARVGCPLLEPEWKWPCMHQRPPSAR